MEFWSLRMQFKQWTVRKTHLIICSLNCIQCDQNSTYETGLRPISNVEFCMHRIKFILDSTAIVKFNVCFKRVWNYWKGSSKLTVCLSGSAVLGSSWLRSGQGGSLLDAAGGWSPVAMVGLSAGDEHEGNTRVRQD